jgi:pyruvate,orthophosphate dikinase
LPSTAAATKSKYVYDFSEGSREMRDLLGGKGANIAEMTRILGADRVPAGFTITTEACVAYMESGGRFPGGLDDQLAAALAGLEQHAERRLGERSDPLLVSVRSGARVSMPGMLDTVLNLGLNDESVHGLADRTRNPRFAWDSYRRLVQMFGNVVRGVSGHRFEEAIAEAKRGRGVEADNDLDADDLRELTARFGAIYEEATGEGFPQDPTEQLRQAIGAVFDSWNGDRAVAYRRINHIPGDWGTAVNVQQMVFGNKGDDSGSGVAFSRDQTTGAPQPSGDFLINAQGEDVVAGTRNPEDLAEFGRRMPHVHAELLQVMDGLERHYKDMQDVEFTVEEGRLYLLQTRSAKRPAQAAVRFAHDAVAEGLLTPAEALLTIDAAGLDALLHPTFDPAHRYEVLARGIPASPGAAKGAIVFSAAEAVRRGGDEDVILVRPFTEADDVAGFHAARGILTAEGGKASHAALVARGMGRPCVCGASDLEVDPERELLRVDGRQLVAGDLIAIDGSTGAITLDDVPLILPEIGAEFREVLGWADATRRLGVRANADNPEDAARSRSFGAEGIGLCRTEHMFFGEDREQLVRQMFVAAARWRRAEDRALAEGEDGGEGEEVERRLSTEAFHAALGRLGVLQERDFRGIFEAMRGLPVTFRLLDPPLHEFLPLHLFEEELEEARRLGAEPHLAEAQVSLAVVRDLQEANPMLGTRGIRLGVLYPPIYEMQVRAIVRAAVAASQGTEALEVEIMLPLVAYEGELEALRELVCETADDALATAGATLDYSVGTMLELPRACLIADRIARHADFFSFGTNDLTQTVAGFSRDDVEGSFLPVYLERGFIDRSPFETIDVPGVGELVRMGCERGRSANSELRLGICGEHGGDPDSIGFFHRAGLDYVSCSPYRVPIARIAAAQAAIMGGAEEGAA